MLFEIHYDEYNLGENHLINLLKPVPANKMIPEFFKRIPTEVNNSGTVKKCAGVLDIMSSGYLFLWPFDATIDKDQDGKYTIYKTRTGTNEHFHPHPHPQMDGYIDPLLESQAEGIQKLTTPFRIKTPPGTSIIVKQPPYRPELKTEVMEGIIDTDKYYGEFNILFMIKNIESNRKFKISAGTPLAQVIPYIRGEWEASYQPMNHDEKMVFDSYAQNVDKFYKEYFWERKIFKDEE